MFDITNVMTNVSNSIEININVDIPKDYLEKTSILELKDVTFVGSISKVIDYYNIKGLLKGIMILPDDVTLERVSIPFRVEIDTDFGENFETDENTDLDSKYVKYSLDKTDTTDNTDTKNNYINLSPSISSWRFYNIMDAPIKKNTIGYLNPKKFGGLSYKILEYRDNNHTVVINTVQFGKVKIFIYNTASTITNRPKYKSGNY